VPPIAIKKWMDLHQPVMKSHRDFISFVCAKFNPSLGIVQQLAQGHRNLPTLPLTR
jgi:hypothetical protein